MRRKRLDITPWDDRYSEFAAGTSVGSEKFDKKKELAMERFKEYGARFTATVDKIISSVLDRHAVIGSMRMKYYALGRRIARFVARYSDVPADRLNLMIAPLATAFSRIHRLDEAIAAAVVNALIEHRDEIVKAAGK